MTLAEFLLARLADDQERAEYVQRQIEGQWPDPEPWRLSWHDEYDLLCIEPSRALAEVAAKKKIVNDAVGWVDGDHGGTYSEKMARHLYDRTLRLLALAYADHPDFQQEWRTL